MTDCSRILQLVSPAVRTLAGLLFCWFTTGDPVSGQNRTLRMAFHVFQDEEGLGNFQRDSRADLDFLDAIADWVNHKLGHLDTLKPAVPSPFVGDAMVRIRVDSVYFHRDRRAWDASKDVDAPYIREVFVDHDKTLTYRQKFQTLPVFISGNHQVAGGHTMGIGDKGYIATRGYYHQFQFLEYENAVEECGKNLFHELGHCLGLIHNFQGGPNGEQCDQCEDNGCPVEGTSNNIMDYWPGYGHAISLCQFRIIQSHLNGDNGDISEVVVNDSCYRLPEVMHEVSGFDTVAIPDTVYAHGDYHILDGGCLRITGYLSMPAGCTVFIGTGGCLEIDGGCIGNLCGELWNGVVLTNDKGKERPRIRMVNHGCIENALTGILARVAIDGQFEQAVFINSVKSLDLKSIPRDRILIKESEFRTTGKLNQYEEGITPVSFIDITDYRFVEVVGCRFVNEKGTLIFDADFTGTGMIIRGSDLAVRGSEFTNLYLGIVVAGTDPTHSLILEDNSFIHNRCGVYTDFPGLIRIGNNLLRLQRFNNRSTYGIRMEQPDRLVVENNHFESVYGAGSMAGLFLYSPSVLTGKIAGNRFTRLPVGVFIENPPDVDQVLLEAVNSGTGGAFQLDLGPQLYENVFIETDIRLVFLPGSGHGTTIGYPADVKFKTDISPISWPVGGYVWYNHQVPLAALDLSAIGNGRQPEHGFYFFMNYLNLEGMKTGVFEGRGQDWEMIRGNLLNYQRAFAHPDEFSSGGDFSILTQVSRVPSILRSGNLAAIRYLENAAERRWLIEAMSGMAGNFNHADSLLADLGRKLAEQHAREWTHEPSVGAHGDSDRVSQRWENIPVLDDLPPMQTFRFQTAATGARNHPAYYLWPNPCGEVIHINPDTGYSPRTGWHYRIVSLSGQLASVGRADEWSGLMIDVSGLPAGTYVMSINTNGEDLGRRLFVKFK